ncbi:MAG: hypothetical protein ACON5B_07880 [Myxococcota bacterium]
MNKLTLLSVATLALSTACGGDGDTDATADTDSPPVVNDTGDAGDRLITPSAYGLGLSTGYVFTPAVEADSGDTADGTEAVAGAINVTLNGELTKPTITIAVYDENTDAQTEEADCTISYERDAKSAIPAASWVGDNSEVVFGLTLDTTWSVSDNTCEGLLAPGAESTPTLLQQVGFAVGIDTDLDDQLATSVGPRIPGGADSLLGAGALINTTYNAFGFTLGLPLGDDLTGTIDSTTPPLTAKEMVVDGQLQTGFYTSAPLIILTLQAP